MIEFKKLDTKIQHGYLLIVEKHATEGCDEWLYAWEDIKQLMKESGAKDIYELDEKYPWSDYGSPSELMRDIKHELRAAGVKVPAYQQKYNAFCEETVIYNGIAKPEGNKRYDLKNGFYAMELSESDLAALDIRKTPAPFKNQAKTGRNEPCPCGSGKKYKKCCGAKTVG